MLHTVPTTDISGFFSEKFGSVTHSGRVLVGKRLGCGPEER